MSRKIPPPATAQELLHELQTYQIELEMQNEQLRQSQLELEKSRDRYIDFYDLAPVGYITLNRTGMIVEINLTCARMLGSERTLLLNRQFSTFVSIQDVARWHRYFLSVLNNDKRQCEFLINRPEGSNFHGKLDSLCLKNIEGDDLIRMVLTDISESVRAKQALQESEQQFRTLTEAMPQMVWITRADGWSIYFNQQWVEYTGLSLNDSYGHGWNQAFHPDDRKRAWEAWQHAAQSESLYSLESRLRDKDGNYRWWLVRGTARRDQFDRIINWFGTCTDITEQKKTEQQLLKSLQKTAEKERSKTRFLAAAGHDLRQPVAAANLFVYALKQTHPTPQQNELIGKLDQSMNAFSDLLNQLLDISKFDAGVIKPQKNAFNLSDLCELLEQTFTQTATGRCLKFHQFFSTRRALLVHTDIGLLRSVLMNLVSNALKFTSRGGVLVSARPRGNRVLIQVWDTGIGISQEQLPLIFDEFYQIGNSQRNREAGLGLGLSICQRAILLLGESINCRSQPGKGSVFEFSLPLIEEQRQSERKTEQEDVAVAATLFSAGTRVMVLEDDELVAKGIVSLLRSFDCQVYHYDNAEQALAEDITADYHLVDYTLSGKLNGIDFLEAKQKKSLIPLRAVIVTGETSTKFIRSAASCRWPLLHKPVDFEKLARALHAQH